MSTPFPVRGEEESLDQLLPTPRRGKFFATEIKRPELKALSGVIIPEEGDISFSTEPKRGRVTQLGEPPEGEQWDFEVDDEIAVPYHAGYRYTWRNQLAIEESRWVLDFNEPIMIFKQRK